ncbi:MAG: DUF924 family protein [Pseudomonadota bacterium]
MKKNPRDPVEEISRFWLDEVGADSWYEQSDEIDRICTDRFLGDWQIAMAGGYRSWLSSAKGAFAFLLLTDQLSRNMFRGTPAAFASDNLALQVAKIAAERDYDQATPELERQFFFLPFMHAEVLSEQERCVRLFMLRSPLDVGDNLRHAILHRNVIRQFGRFPSRNAILGRTDSAAEIAYREEGGYMSG